MIVMFSRCQKMTNLSPNHYFYSVWATSKSDGLEVVFYQYVSVQKTYMFLVFFWWFWCLASRIVTPVGVLKQKSTLRMLRLEETLFEAQQVRKSWNVNVDPRSRRVTKSCFWGAIWMVQHRIFIKKPLDVCKKSPPPYGAKNQHVNITKDVCKKSPPEILGSVRGRRLFAHVLGNIDILVPWRRLKRSNLSPNHDFYNVWATSQKSVARRISGRQKRSDCCKN